MMIKVSREVNLMEVGKNGVDMAAGAEGRALFPRLHVKETKISGPRAPPRNKMALYEQLSIPSHRYVASAARQNPPTLLNQSVTCDTRLVYAPYYVTPNTYSHVNFHGQFIAHNVTSGDNNSLNEVGKSDPGSIRTREASDATTSNSHASKAPSSRNGIVSSGPVAGDTCHQSCGLSKSSRTNDAAAGSLHNREDSSSPAGGVALDSMRKTQSPVGPPSQRQECSMKLDYITDSGGKKAELLKNPSPGLKSNGQCSEAMSLDESSNEGVEEDSRVDTEDNYRCKNSSSSESIVSSKGIDHCSSKQNCQTAGSGHAPHNVQEDTSLCAESYHKGEKLSKDSENATDSCPWRDASVKRQHTVQIHIGHPNRTNSGSLAAAEGENSDHNSDSSMVDSIHIFEITPQSVIEAIGQKEFWKVRRAILRQQKIFSTQVFELHRLVKVQKLIAMSPNLLIDDAVFENIPISASEEQRVPCIEPENFRKTASMDGTPNTDSDMSKGKADKKELKNQSPLPSRASVVSHVSQSGEVRSNVHACSSPLATAVPGLASAWSYPIFPQNYYGAVSHQGGYVGYNPYAFNQVGGPGIVMGIPCGLEGTLMNQPSVNVSPNQFTGSAEFQFHGMGHFPSPPFNGTCYSMSPSLGKFPHSTGSAVGAGSQKEMSAASNGHESVARESKHSAVYTSEKTSSASHFHEYISNIASRPAKQPATQTHTNNMKLHGDSTPAHLISEQKQSSNPQGNERCTAMRWSRSSNSYRGHNLREPDGRSITRASIDLENQALALFPMSSSVSGASESAKENSAPEQRVRVIKAVPRAAVAASETTADILLSLQRERRQ